MKINLDLEKIHNINVEKGTDEIEVVFETKKFDGVIFTMNITKEHDSKEYGYKIKEEFLGKHSKRQTNIFFQWLSKYKHDLLHYFLKECPDTLIVIKVLLG